jgi:hypothetical protein
MLRSFLADIHDGNKARWYITSSLLADIHGAVVHASEFIPGSVTLVVEQEPGIWWLGSYQTCSLRGL